MSALATRAKRRRRRKISTGKVLEESRERSCQTPRSPGEIPIGIDLRTLGGNRDLASRYQGAPPHSILSVVRDGGRAAGLEGLEGVEGGSVRGSGGAAESSGPRAPYKAGGGVGRGRRERASGEGVATPPRYKVARE
jgi:hypothetical protein